MSVQIVAAPRISGVTLEAASLLGAAVLLIWPALWNGYPLVFSDTGTYLSQAVEHHFGWDRPVFYSLFLLPLHATITTWPAILVQGLLIAFTLKLVLGCFGGRAVAWLLPAIAALLAIGTGLPWVAAELLPDFTTPLLPLVLALLVAVPERLGRTERLALMGFAAALIAVHLSNVPLAAALLAVLLPLRWALGVRPRLGWRVGAGAVGPLAVAILALCAANLIGHGRASLSPYGNVFLLVRMIYDGPAMDTLRRHCPQSGWRMCVLTHEPKPDSADDFLWQPDSALYRVGGPKAVAAEAGEIIHAAWREEPAAAAAAMLGNTARQLGMFATGDGLNPWPRTVTPVIHRDFPRFEAATYDAARQTRGELRVPAALQAIYYATTLVGMLVTLGGMAVALRWREPVALLCAAVLVCLIGNAAITGALSGPHARYQARVVWLAAFAPMVIAAALRRGDRPSGELLLRPLPDPMPVSSPGNQRLVGIGLVSVREPRTEQVRVRMGEGDDLPATIDCLPVAAEALADQAQAGVAIMDVGEAFQQIVGAAFRLVELSSVAEIQHHIRYCGQCIVAVFAEAGGGSASRLGRM